MFGIVSMRFGVIFGRFGVVWGGMGWFHGPLVHKYSINSRIFSRYLVVRLMFVCLLIRGSRGKTFSYCHIRLKFTENNTSPLFQFIVFPRVQ